MTDPVTHLLWGYVVARSLTDRQGYLLLGMMSGVLLDVDALIPGFTHHGWLHTPVFVAFLAVTLWGASRERSMLLVPAAAMGSHLVLDSVGGSVMWLWPVSEASMALVPVASSAGMAAASVFLFVAPSYGVWDRWKRTGESPIAVLNWVGGFVPRPVSWGGAGALGLVMVLLAGQRYLLAVMG